MSEGSELTIKIFCRDEMEQTLYFERKEGNKNKGKVIKSKKKMIRRNKKFPVKNVLGFH